MPLRLIVAVFERPAPSLGLLAGRSEGGSVGRRWGEGDETWGGWLSDRLEDEGIGEVGYNVGGPGV